ncbi:hypothetical protein BH20CHL6_BH20CHL6_06990 [soil metagenome]
MTAAHRPTESADDADGTVNAEDAEAAEDIASDGRQAGLRGRLTGVLARVMGLRPVREGQAVLDIFGRHGGGLLAAGLAFQTLFALLAASLFLAGLAGLLIEDPDLRTRFVAEVATRIPPLTQIVSGAVTRLAENAGTFSLVGLAVLLWRASSFAAALDGGLAQFFPSDKTRNFIKQRLGGVVAVLAIVVAAIVGLALGSLSALVESTVAVEDAQWFWRLTGPVLTTLIMTMAVLVIYRVVPTSPPSYRAALPPAAVAGTAIAVLTVLFTQLAPRLVGGVEVFGVGIAVFTALIWLNLVFTALLYGAAWARVRKDQEASRPASTIQEFFEREP